MSHQYEYCPKCHGIQHASATIGLQKTGYSKNVEGENLLLHLHCDSCNTYIRSVYIVEGQEVEEASQELQFSQSERDLLPSLVREPA